MKNLLLSLGLGLISLSGLAQTGADAQLPNHDFSKFEADATNKVGDRPVGWKASNVNQKMSLQLVFNASASGEGVKMQNNFVGFLGIGANAPAYITLGETWNFVKGFDPKTGDGGTFGSYAFSYRPDAVEVSYKRVMGTEKPGEQAEIIIYSWAGQTTSTSEKWSGNMIDREKDVMGIQSNGVTVNKSEDFVLVSNTDYLIKPETMQKFETVSIPLNYLDKTVVPEKINVILSSADYYNRPNIGKENVLYVNNISLVYYHELNAVNYDGNTYNITPDQVLDLSSVVYDPAKISFDKKGVGATVETVFDEASHILTVNVLGNDYAVNSSSKTTYTIQFGAPAKKNPLLYVTVGGEFLEEFVPEQREYTLPYAYHPGIVIEAAANEGYKIVMDGTNNAFYDNVAKTITIKAEDENQEITEYVFHFTDVVEGPETGAYKGGLLVTLTGATGQTTKSPLMSNEVVNITNNSRGTVNLSIKNFSFMGLLVGDIYVSNVPVYENEIYIRRKVRLTSYDENGAVNPNALGWNLGIIPLEVKATLHPEAGGKFAEASIDILTSESILAEQFKNIHVDVVPFEFEASEPIMAEKPWSSVNYYSYIKAKGFMTKASARFLQLTNSFINENGDRVDNPMTYIDLTGARLADDVTLDDIMKRAPQVNNTLVYVNATSSISGKNVVKGDVVDELVLSDKAPFFAPKAFTAQAVKYDRQFTVNEISSIVLPFDIPVADLTANIYQLTAVDGITADFDECTDGLKANQPYLIKSANQQLFQSLSNVNVVATPASANEMVVSNGTYHHFATYEALDVTSSENTFYEIVDGKFVKAETATVAPFRAMLASTDANASAELELNNIPTGINHVTADHGLVDVYTLDGKLVRSHVETAQAVQGLAKGLYIVAGKKVIVK